VTAVRPLLKPALPRLWRDTDTVQLGLDPDRAVVLGGVDPRGLRLLALLDGTRDVPGLVADAEAEGIAETQVTAALGMLADAGVLDDAAVPGPPLPGPERDRLAPELAALSLRRPTPGSAPLDLARRREARVRVHGAGRVGAALAAVLAASGVGHLEVVDDGQARPCHAGPAGLEPQDAGRRRDDAAVGLLRRTAPSADARAGATPSRVALAILAGSRAHDLRAKAALAAAGTPHLVATVQEVRGLVGPLVVPGSTPCLDCLDLHRRDRDPGWPLLAAQRAAPGPATTPACDAALALAVAACAALQALAHLDGQLPAVVAGTLELTPPDHRWRRRSWTVHPACGCVAGGTSRARPAGGGQ
jgi:bacteriocin biosynthesis cyclodehydratase domain-containing protein